MSISANKVAYAYSTGGTIFQDLNLEIASGEAVALMAPSGTGKTTLLKLLCGQERSRTGEISVSGHRVDPCEQPPIKMGYLCQEIREMCLPWMQVSANIEMALKNRGELNKINSDRCKWLIETVGLTSKVKSFPYQLSGGELKRLGLAMVLAYKPEVLMLDEPFNSVDIDLAWKLWDLLWLDYSERRPTLLVVTHSFDEAALLATKTMFLNKENRNLVQLEKSAADFSLPDGKHRSEVLVTPECQNYKNYLIQEFRKII